MTARCRTDSLAVSTKFVSKIFLGLCVCAWGALGATTSTSSYFTLVRSPMRVLSWDVGLRTLSYCLIEAEVSSGETTAEDPVAAAFAFQILAWESVDVKADDQIQHDTEAPSVAAAAVKPRTKRAKSAAGTVAGVSVEDGARMIMDALHRRADVLACGVDAIIIEQQPAGGHNAQSNVRMKVMSHAIQCYFYTRSLLSHVFVPPTISFVSASSKFSEMVRKKGGDGPAAPPPVEDDSSSSTTSSSTTLVLVRDTAGAVTVATPAAPAPAKPVSGYSRNKKYAVQKTVELLTRQFAADHRARQLLEATKKKDDLADSFLLGYYFLKKQFDAHQVQASRVAKSRSTGTRTPRAKKGRNAGAEAECTAGNTEDAALSHAPRPPPEVVDVSVKVTAPKGRKRKAVT